MSDKDVEELESRVRHECASIASAESAYWAELESDEAPLRDIVIGGMGAAANIAAAILLGRTPEEYAADIKARDKNVSQ